MFTSNTSYWLDLTIKTFRIRNDSQLRRDTTRPAYSLMQRAGWVLKGESEHGKVFEKELPHGWLLRRITKYGRADRHELERAEDSTNLAFSKWEWAEWDRNRLVWVELGCLRAAKLGAHKLGTIRTLYDFNDMTPP